MVDKGWFCCKDGKNGANLAQFSAFFYTFDPSKKPLRYA
jgi:hypothetical protein